MPLQHVLGSQSRGPRSACVWICLVAFLGAAGARAVVAQEIAPVALGDTEAVTAQKREELYRTLRRHAEVIEAQTAIVKTVAKLVGPAVVHIEANVRQRAGRILEPHESEEAGSGVLIRIQDGYYVLTNRHVIRGATPGGVRITLADGRKIHPTLIREDRETDIAVMSVSAPALVAAEVGNSDRMEIGDFVLAVGSPFGLSHSITFGIVSAKGRRDLRLGNAPLRFQDFLQTDAAINPGNSGGPLINLRGEVVGINTAIASNSGGNEGIGFAIPANMFMFVAAQLIETGEVRRGFLGVNLDARYGGAEARRAGLPVPMGARVTGITAGTPAAEADIRAGDIILELNGRPVENDGHLVNLVGQTPVGSRVPMLIFRDGKTQRVEIEVGDREKLHGR